jgi:hypothetical protein
LRAEVFELEAHVPGRHLDLREYQWVRTAWVSAGGEASSQVVRHLEEVDCLCLPA